MSPDMIPEPVRVRRISGGKGRGIEKEGASDVLHREQERLMSACGSNDFSDNGLRKRFMAYFPELTGCGEKRFLIGHRYKGTPETGQVSLTEDNGKNWKKIELPAPALEEMKYCYSEMLEFIPVN